MKAFSLKWTIIPVLCFLAFVGAFATVRSASSQSPRSSVTGALIDSTTASPGASLPAATPAPQDASSSNLGNTPAPGDTPLPGEFGEPAAAGSVFEKYGVRLQIPDGLGDFRVIYPVIVDWGFPAAPGEDRPDQVMAIYNPQTGSSLFIRASRRRASWRAQYKNKTSAG